MNYSLGQKYIGHYRYLSYVLSNFDRPSNISIQTHIQFIAKTYLVAHKLQFGQSTDTIINYDYKVSALDLINKYRASTSNVKYNLILDELEDDINLYYGKTKTEVLNLIQ